MAVVRTTEGTLVKPGKTPTAELTPEQLADDAARRNAEAERLGIKARYVVAED